MKNNQKFELPTVLVNIVYVGPRINLECKNLER